MVAVGIIKTRIKKNLEEIVRKLVENNEIFSEDDLKIKLVRELHDIVVSGDRDVDIRAEHTLKMDGKRSGKIDLLIYIKRKPKIIIELKVALFKDHSQVWVTNEKTHSVECDLEKMLEVVLDQNNSADIAVMVVVGCTHGGQSSEWNSTELLDITSERYEEKFRENGKELITANHIIIRDIEAYQNRCTEKISRNTKEWMA